MRGVNPGEITKNNEQFLTDLPLGTIRKWFLSRPYVSRDIE